MTTSHYRNTIYIAYYLSLSLFFITSAAATRSLIRQFNTNLQQKEIAKEVHYLQKHQEISWRDYNKVSASNTMIIQDDRGPSNYRAVLQSFDTIINSTLVDKFETRPFSAGGYSWILYAYPTGNKQDGGSGYLSLYLAIDTSALVDSAHKEVYADVRFYIYNINEEKYSYSIQDIDAYRFTAYKSMWGVSQVLPIDILKDQKNGYIFMFNNAANFMFGVDVTVSIPLEQSEVFTVRKSSEKFTWTIEGFSTLLRISYLSDEFTIGARGWKLEMVPNGRGTGEGNAVSLFLIPTTSNGDYELIYIRGKLRVLNQLNLDNLERPLERLFGRYNNESGYDEFISFTDLKDSSKGFLVNDTLKVEVELEVASTTNYFP